MPKESYKEALKEAKREYENLQKVQEEVEARIIQLHQSIASLSALCGEQTEAWASLGLTDAVRFVLKIFSDGLTPPQVKEKLEEMGFHLEKYENALSAIHTILKRLVKSEEVIRLYREEGEAVYILRPPELKFEWPTVKKTKREDRRAVSE